MGKKKGFEVGNSVRILRIPIGVSENHGKVYVGTTGKIVVKDQDGLFSVQMFDTLRYWMSGDQLKAVKENENG